MNKQEILQKTQEFVKQTLEGEGTGHDWWHIYRVWKNALHIGKNEEVDLFVVQLGALLHDIADYKFHDGDDSIGPKVAREWLESQNVEEQIISHVCEIIKSTSFKGSGVDSSAKTKEAMVVQDADRLDAMGAIGVARTFAYGGHKNREIYNPNIKPEKHTSFEHYKNNTSPTINHFYEKLLLLKGRMHTETAKIIAIERHQFMEQFLERFYKEWDLNL
jgi:uncharacterized protein